MRLRFILTVVLLSLAGLLALSSRTRWARRKSYRRLLQDLSRSDPASHSTAAPAQAHTTNAVVWFVRGVHASRAGNQRDAARAFGMAHHVDASIISAALLTFAGLKSSDGANTDFLEQLVRTWNEMNRPDVRRTVEDRIFTDAFIEASSPPPPQCSSLGRLAWAVTGSALREKLSGYCQNRPAWAEPLFDTPDTDMR